jgi:hypothetical protein
MQGMIAVGNSAPATAVRAQCRSAITATLCTTSPATTKPETSAAKDCTSSAAAGTSSHGALFAVAVAASALAAVVTYRYINVSAVGPLPDMYEPTRAVSGKQLSAFAVAIATGASPSRPHQPERTSPAEFRRQRKRETTPPAASAD